MIIIDRFEEDFAILEIDEKTIRVNKGFISENAKEGDVLNFDGKSYLVDSEATKIRRQKLISFKNKLLS